MKMMKKMMTKTKMKISFLTNNFFLKILKNNKVKLSEHLISLQTFKKKILKKVIIHNAGIISPTHRGPFFLIPKGDGSLRPICDYAHLTHLIINFGSIRAIQINERIVI